MTFVDVDLSGARASGTRFLDCCIERCDLDDADLRRARLLATAVQDVRGARVRAGGGTWRDVSLTRSRIGYLEAAGAEWTRVGVTGCRFDYLDLREAHVTDLRLLATDVRELDLSHATATKVAVAGSIGVLDVTGARLEHVDLRRTEFDTIRGVAHLRGLTITRVQFDDLAPALAAHCWRSSRPRPDRDAGGGPRCGDHRRRDRRPNQARAGHDAPARACELVGASAGGALLGAVRAARARFGLREHDDGASPLPVPEQHQRQAKHSLLVRSAASHAGARPG